MSGWQWVWLSLFAVGGVVEILALVNRRTGDTLSEQLWRILGVFPPSVCYADGKKLPCREHGYGQPVEPHRARRLPPAWIRVRRFAFIAVTGWLVLHFATGWV